MHEPDGKIKILIAEDSPLGRKLAVKMIEHCGHTADPVENGRQAVEKASSNSYDLILMDMFMPELNGGDAALEISKTSASVPIIALSGDVIGSDELARYGMKDSILKPLSERELDRVISEYCTRDGNRAQANPSNAIAFSAAVFDEKSALGFVGGNKALLSEMLCLFVQGTEKNIEKLSSAVVSGDMKTVKSVTHLIKGESKSLGALKISSVAAEINEAAKLGDKDRCARMIPELKTELQEFRVKALKYANI